MKMDDTNSPRLPFFFILGRPRSGTTLLRTLFDAHPHVIIPPECPLILHIYPDYKKGILPNEKNIAALMHTLQGIHKFNDWNVDITALRYALLQCKKTLKFDQLIALIYLSVPSLYPKESPQYLGDKNPIYALYPKKLKSLFPDAKFIFLVRDYRDNILSILRLYPEFPVIATHAIRWREVFKKFHRMAVKHPHDFLLLRYEDLAEKPEDTLKKACTFLGITWSAHMLQFHAKGQEASLQHNAAFNEKWHPGLYQPIHTDTLGRWKKVMQEKDVRLVDTIVGKWAEIAGYQRASQCRSIPRYLLHWPAILYTHYLTAERLFLETLRGGLPPKHSRKRWLFFSLIKKCYHCDSKYLTKN